MNLTDKLDNTSSSRLADRIKVTEDELAKLVTAHDQAESDAVAKAGEDVAYQKAADKAADLEQKLADLQKELEEAKKAAAEAGDDDDADATAEVTDSDRTQAQRVAEAFLEDVFSDDEDKTNKAIKDGTFREEFAQELKRAHRKYVKRIKAHVRADKDWWETTISKFLLKDW